MLDSLTLLYIHIISAYTSLILFLLRSALQFASKDWRQIKLLKILPHFSDSLLLLSGVTIVVSLGLGLPSWLIIKILLLILYIIFATKSLSRQPQHPRRDFLLALACFLGTFLVAYCH